MRARLVFRVGPISFSSGDLLRSSRSSAPAQAPGQPPIPQPSRVGKDIAIAAVTIGLVILFVIFRG